MPVTPNLTNLSERAKQVEEAVNEAASRTRDELAGQVNAARETAQTGASGLKAAVAVTGDDLSAWWNDIHENWAKNVARIRRREEHDKADRDAVRAERRAERASADADAALLLAYAALDEAEFAILDAALARMDANDARAAA